MKTLFLAHRLPYPPNKGDKIRSYHLLRFLLRQGPVYLGTLIDDPRDRQYLSNLKQLCDHNYVAPLDVHLRKPLSVFAHLVAQPASVRYFYNQRLQLWVDRILSTENIELVFCFSSTMAEYLFRSRFRDRLKAKRIRLLMDFCDVDSRKWLDYGKIKPWLHAVFFQREGRLLHAYEQRIADFFDVCYLASSREKTVFDQEHSGANSNIRVLENGVDLDFFSLGETKKNVSSAPKIVFTGAMDYDVNIDGVCWFVREIWPYIKREIPTSRFYIVGSNPTADVQKLENVEGVQVTGYVDDIRKYYRKADLCVAPLRIARGIQNKVLEAMAMSRPVVCTSNAFEGIVARPGHDLLVVDQARQFAAEVVRLLLDKGNREKLARNGRACIERHYRWSKRLAILAKDFPGQECDS